MIERTVAQVMGGATALHQVIKSNLDFADVIASGIPIRAVKSLQTYIGVSDQRMAKFMSITPKTYRSRKDRFKLNEGNQAYKLALIVVEAEKAIGDKETALEWLDARQPALGNRVPIDLIQTSAGVQAVEDLLGRITYGVYS